MSVSWFRALIRPPLPSGWWHARWFWRLTASDLAWRISGGRVGVRWIRPVWIEEDTWTQSD